VFFSPSPKLSTQNASLSPKGLAAIRITESAILELVKVGKRVVLLGRGNAMRFGHVGVSIATEGCDWLVAASVPVS